MLPSSCWKKPGVAGSNVRARVAEILGNGIRLASGELLPGELIVWAAGVKAPDFLKDIAGLETNRINQLVVLSTLQTTRDENVFAIGDCAACPWLGKEGKLVPPRAQSAHQQASHMFKQIKARLAVNRPLTEWRYRDFGSLVSLGEYSVVGNLMGGLLGGPTCGSRPVRANDVPVAVQDARARAARILESFAGHGGARHHSPHRVARQAPLTTLPKTHALSRIGDYAMTTPPEDPAKWLATIFENSQAMMRQLRNPG